MDPIFLSINDACRVLGCGRSTLYAQISRHNLLVAKVGTRTLVYAESVRDFAAQAAVRHVSSNKAGGAQ